MKINKKVEAKMSMFRVLLFLCMKDTSITILMVFDAIHEVFLQFKEMVGQLDSLMQQKLLIITGLSKDKKATKFMLADLAFRIGGALHAYGYKTGDNDLMANVHHSRSRLKHLSGNDFIEICRNYSVFAGLNSGNIQPYGVDANMLQTFTAAISLFEGKNPQPRGAIEHGATLTKEIALKEKETSDFLDSTFDRVIVMLEADYPSFVKDYFNARKIWDMGSRKVTVPEKPEELAYFLCNIYDANGNPLEDVYIECKNEDNTYTDETDEDGVGYLEGIASGNYQLSIMMYGKKTITEVIDVITNDEICRDYLMEDEVVMLP
jgi:hypothetical protein